MPGVILVIGSVNLDHASYVRTLPRPGETVLAVRSFRGLGGKGANQAVAAARAGAEVRLLGAVGDDEAATTVRTALATAGVDTSLLGVRADAATGLAHITIDDVGENVIVVASGANALLAPADVTPGLAADVDVVLTQGELAVPVIEAAVRLAAEDGARLVLNLAPMVAVDDDVLAATDPLVLNEHEAAALLGVSVEAGLRGAADAARALVARGPRSVVLSLGAAGAVGAVGGDDGVEVWHQPAPEPPSAVVDTTGAGDALTGFLAAALAAGDDVRRALRRGVAAATLATTRRGAAASYPDVATLEALLASAPGPVEVP